MSNIIRIIITKNKVFTSRNEIVFFENSFKEVNDLSDRVQYGDDIITPIINKAKCIAYDHACGNTNLIIYSPEVKNEIWNIDDMFNYLEKIKLKY